MDLVNQSGVRAAVALSDSVRRTPLERIQCVYCGKGESVACGCWKFFWLGKNGDSFTYRFRRP